MDSMQNDEYERALLGQILMDNAVREEYQIDRAIFSVPLNARVYECIEKAMASGAVANIAELARMMPEEAAFIARLTSYPSAANAGYHVAELRELSRRRAIMRMAREASEMTRDYQNKSDDIIAACDRILLEISMNKGGGYRHVSACMDDALAMILKAHELKGKLSGVPTGFDMLDRWTCGWQPGTLNIIGARPGAGKTSIALNMASAALRAGYPVGFFSAEMNAASIIKRMVSDWGLVNFGTLNSGFFSEMDLPKIEKACIDIAATRLYVNDTPNIKLGALIEDARRMKRKEGAGILFVDYLSLVDNKRSDIPRHEQVAEISRTLKCLSRELEIPIIALSQLTREAQGERPKLSQLRDSGGVEQDADMVILLWNKGWTDERHEELDIVFIVEKNRNGQTGDVDMIFKPSRMRFAEKEYGKEEAKV